MLRTFYKRSFSTLSNEEIYKKNIHLNHIIASIGPAGSGKTYIACNYAINALKNKEYEKIIITRPVTTLD